MKKSILVLALLFAVNQSNCSIFDTAMGFLKKTASSLFDKGKKFLSDNSGKILATVKEKGGELVQKGIGMAKEKGGELLQSYFKKPTSTEDVTNVVTQAQAKGTTMEQAESLVLDTANVVADKEIKELTTQAQSIVATTQGLTPAEQKIILQEAQNLANQNRAALERQAKESIAQKRAALKSSIYEKYGKGTPTVK